MICLGKYCFCQFVGDVYTHILSYIIHISRIWRNTLTVAMEIWIQKPWRSELVCLDTTILLLHYTIYILYELVWTWWSFCVCAVVHVPAPEGPGLLSQPERPSQRPEATEPAHQQSECLNIDALVRLSCVFGSKSFSFKHAALCQGRVLANECTIWHAS